MVDKAIVYSPLSVAHNGLQLALYPRNGRLHARVLSDKPIKFEVNCVGNQQGVIWIPTRGYFGRCRRGFVLKNRDDGVIATFGPRFDEVAGRGWPDWRTVLNARGIALLFCNPLFEKEATETDWPAVILDEENETPGDDWEEGWINPLVVGYRHGGAIPGMNEDLDRKAANDINRAIAAATKPDREWHLVSLPGEDGMRRFIGWHAIARTRGKDTVASRLTSLFHAGSVSADAKPESVRAADLAALDELEGRFEAVWDPDGKGTQWRWRQPEGLDAARAQLARHLARELSLCVVDEPGNDTADVFDWRLRPPPARRRETVLLADAESGQGIAALLCVMSKSGELGSDAPTLRPLASALAQEAETLDPDIAHGLFQPLVDAAFIRSATGLRLDTRVAFATLVKQFFTPKSPVLIPMTEVKLMNLDRATREAFDKDWGGRWIDLFQSPGRGAADTLRAVVGHRHAAAEETMERDGWWSAFWRHCVLGDHTVQFRLRAADRVFVLDVSRLDRAPLG